MLPREEKAVDYDQLARPNILLICVDHWPGDLLGSAGHPCVMTPTLDQLAANGVRFTNAYSASPTCVPARRGLLGAIWIRPGKLTCKLRVVVGQLAT